MNEPDFRKWLEEQEKVPASISTRLSDARRIERLFGDLDEAYDTDKGTSVLAKLAYSKTDERAGKPSPKGLAIDGNVYKSLASYRAAISAYVKFRQGSGDRKELSQADKIRDFVIERYAKPARQRGHSSFTVRAGDVHRDMALENAMPSVCGALDSKKFATQLQATLTERKGPANSSTVKFTFTFVEQESFNVAAAEAELRRRYGKPIKDLKRLVAHELPNRRQIALERDRNRVQIWIEKQLSDVPSNATTIRHYAPDQSRNADLPEGLKHAPPDRAKPNPVSLIHVSNMSALRVLLDWYEGGKLNRNALNRYREAFLAKYPDFLPGAFTKSEGTYVDDERGYKDRLLVLVRQAIEEESEPTKLGARVLDILIGASGSPSNLLGWRTERHVKEIRRKHPDLLEIEAARLASSDDPDSAIDAFVNATWPMLVEGQDSKPYSASRRIPTMLAALVHPERAFGINTDRFSRVAHDLSGKRILGPNPLSREEYTEALSLATDVRDVMEKEWGWHPRDLWDVQGFIWVTGDQDDPEILEDEEMSLTRDAVLKAIDECSRLTVGEFLKTYGFAKPHWYWISERGELFPCKAIASVAHAYLPGGRSS